MLHKRTGNLARDCSSLSRNCLGMQFLFTELLRGETRTMYSLPVADVIDDQDEAHERDLHAAPLHVPHADPLQLLMQDVSTWHVAPFDVQ